MNSSVLHVVVVGDSQVGKTSTLLNLRERYSKTLMPLSRSECIPSVLDAFEINYLPNNNNNSTNGSSTPSPVCMDFFDKILFIDTPSDDDQSLYRKEHFYKEGQVFVIMFALDRISSFEKVHDYYLEIKEAVITNVTMILVGCKCDLTDRREVTLFEGLELQRKIGAKVYLEISNVSGKNLNSLIDNCVKLGSKLLMQSPNSPSSQLSDRSQRELINESRPKILQIVKCQQ
ncbi:hypothetical protein C9374_007663 [Naegleria lovaniensis]|uniref:Ras family small GTPase n=1 Tax=Naegleria lovaniensis TaxID=51637 RepID=A0AA88GLL6_NAELO|nr:uncharacterized protein C9374_007663 [Naegleria lovaniensis]KAG2379025.1 hypothetical protein C9374_007663 [Naegleria lovaniensis]